MERAFVQRVGFEACPGADDRNNGRFVQIPGSLLSFTRVDRRGIGSLSARRKIEVAAKTSLSQITSFRPLFITRIFYVVYKPAPSRSA